MMLKTETGNYGVKNIVQYILFVFLLIVLCIFWAGYTVPVLWAQSLEHKLDKQEALSPQNKTTASTGSEPQSDNAQKKLQPEDKHPQNPPALNSKKTSQATGWFPGTRLYQTMLADPRKTTFSGTFRINDHGFDRYKEIDTGRDAGIIGDDRIFGAFSAGGRIPFYRWKLPEGFLQAGIEGGIWALFAFRERDSVLSTMINADYLLGLVTEYRWESLSLQFRYYHLSSHVGDEFLQQYQDFDRINLSHEALDLFVSYDIIPQLRLYAGLGCLVHHFKSYSFDPVYIEYGLETRPFAKMKAGKAIWWQPFIAIHFRNWQNNSWTLDGHYMLGIELLPDRMLQNTRFQFFVSYYHGNCLEGQFYNLSSSYFSLGIAFEI